MIARFIVAPWTFVCTFGRKRPKLETLKRQILAVLLVSVACSARSDDELVVFAAASLTEFFGELDKLVVAFDSTLRVQHNFAGSQQLAQQIAHGAEADIFATADERWMKYLEERSLVTDVRPFAASRMVVVAQATLDLHDLATPGTQIVIGADAVPAGHYARTVIANMQTSKEFGPDFAAAVLNNIVSEEDNVRGVLAKVILGEADAGFVYLTDVLHLNGEGYHAIAIPDDVNVSATYFIAQVKGASGHGVATYLRILRSGDGHALLSAHGFSPI